MKSLTIGSVEMAGSNAARRSMAQQILLACGVLSSLVYIAANILGALVWEGYNLISYSISELSAIDAPSRPLVVPLMLLYSILVIAFGVGIWQTAGQKRSLRITAGLVVGFGIICLTGPFTPMHQREVLAAGGETITDTLHIAATIVNSLFIFLIIGFGAAAFGKRFQLYSIATILVLFVVGAVSGMDGPRVAANLPTPWLGLTERILLLSYLLWIIVLAAGLLRVQPVKRAP